jgi:cytochrome P450
VANTLTLDNLDIVDPDVYVEHGYPFEAWDILRREAPVYWYERPNVRPFWAITKHEDILAISKDPTTFISAPQLLIAPSMTAAEVDQAEAAVEQARQTQIPGLPGGDYGDQRHLLVMDPPEHGIYRNLVGRNFTPRALKQLEAHIDQLSVEYVDEVARLLVDDVAERGSCDFVTDLAAKMPLAVICELMGVPREDWDDIFDWTNKTIGSGDPEYQDEGAAPAAMMDLFGYFAKTLEQRKTAGSEGEDLITTLVHAEVDGEPLNIMDIVSYCFLLIVAGNETTRNATTGGMLALIEHPDQRARLRDDPSLITTAVEEMLRWTSPVIQFARTATVDVVIRGQQIKAGEVVGLYYPSANRDEELFEDSYAFDVGREPNDHLAFGGFGEHFCLGANLARTELRSIFRELMVRIPDLELAGDVDRLRSSFVGGIKHMPVEFRPSKGSSD